MKLQEGDIVKITRDWGSWEGEVEIANEDAGAFSLINPRVVSGDAPQNLYAVFAVGRVILVWLSDCEIVSRGEPSR